MQFSDTSNLTGIVQDITFLLGGIDTNDYVLKDRARNVNEHFRKVWHRIFNAYGGWRWDDSNQTDLPQATATLTSGTSKYTIPTGSLTVYSIEIKNSSGIYSKITPLTAEQIEQFGTLTELNDSAATGVPSFYRLVGDTIELFPNPNYTASAGIKVYFDRDISSFSSNDTTKTPGFAAPYHRILSIGAAMDYASANNMVDKITILLAMYNEYMNNIGLFYSERWRDKQPKRITVPDLMREFS